MDPSSTSELERMSAPKTMPADPTPIPPTRDEVGPVRALLVAIRTRIISGLIAALPIALTFWIVYWLYSTLTQVVLRPAIEAVRYVMGNRGLSETFWYSYFAPLIAVVLVLFLLYSLGLFVSLRLLRVVDWVMLHVPVVNTIFKALSNVFEALGKHIQESSRGQVQRIVLVEFPHPGIRSLAMVTNTLHDATTGRTILCVCVLTGVMPPAGFTLLVPEEQVTNIDWTMNETLQAILSGGITAPGTIHYFQGLPAPAGSGGALVDAHGQPVAPTAERHLGTK
jgi:uncharacterized membrane protein